MLRGSSALAPGALLCLPSLALMFCKVVFLTYSRSGCSCCCTAVLSFLSILSQRHHHCCWWTRPRPAAGLSWSQLALALQDVREAPSSFSQKSTLQPPLQPKLCYAKIHINTYFIPLAPWNSLLKETPWTLAPCGWEPLQRLVFVISEYEEIMECRKDPENESSAAQLNKTVTCAWNEVQGGYGNRTALRGKLNVTIKLMGTITMCLFIFPDDTFDMKLSLEWKIYKCIFNFTVWPR